MNSVKNELGVTWDLNVCLHEDGKFILCLLNVKVLNKFA